MCIRNRNTFDLSFKVPEKTSLLQQRACDVRYKEQISTWKSVLALKDPHRESGSVATETGEQALHICAIFQLLNFERY